MPTGYTCKIENKEIKTPKEFLHICLRHFGVMSHMRDYSINTPDYVDWDKLIEDETSYSKKQLAEAEEKLNFFMNATEADKAKIKEEHKQKLADDIKEENKYIKQANKKNAVYDEFISKISAWNCSEEFNSIKNFAINQCEISKESIDGAEDIIKAKQEEIDNNLDSYVDDYIKREIDFYAGDVDFYKKEIESVKKNILDKKAFYEKFMKEIEKLED